MEQVLVEEACKLAPPGSAVFHKHLSEMAEGQDAERARTEKNADVRDGDHDSQTEAESRKGFYRSLNDLNRSALCLSGGGIRSATFCLGVIQALAAFDVKSGDVSRRPRRIRRSRRTLCSGRFQFLSTVSGGGYIGSWLSAWRT